MKVATVKLEHGRVQVIGPEELVIWIKALSISPSASEQKQAIYLDQLKNWFVLCSITKEQIPLSELRYWNVGKNEVYKSPEVIPQ